MVIDADEYSLPQKLKFAFYKHKRTRLKMQEQIKSLFFQVISKIASEQNIHEIPTENEINIDRCRDPNHGDFSTNIAMKIAKKFKMKPLDLAEKISANIEKIAGIAEIYAAAPGFINIRLEQTSQTAVLSEILRQGENFGKVQATDKSPKILLEFVSANPTGPLHVGHGRGAAYGASLANLLKACGNQVSSEYYVNDAGRQMDILALSLYWRYAQVCGDEKSLPKGIYQGEYVKEVAKELFDSAKNSLYQKISDWVPEYPEVWSEEQIDDGTRDRWIDAAIAALKAALGQEKYEIVFNKALKSQLDDIAADLEEFGVKFDRWYSEKSLFTEAKIEKALEKLAEGGFLYEQNGAIWFKATEFGDEKDRVVKRDNGITTYFASDIAYHLDKYERGYDQMIDIFGADHHGYMARVRASLAALKLNPEQLTIALVQFAVLYQNGNKVQMSTRSGEFVTLRNLREEVGSEAARFFYVLRKPDQHLDFDLDLALSNSRDNPYYYVQYAHARACRVLEKAENEGKKFSPDIAEKSRSELKLAEETEIVALLARYPDTIISAGRQLAPHIVINYLRELASVWHHYYDAGHKLICEEENLRNARLLLAYAVKTVLANGLKIIGVQAKDKM